MARKRIKSGTNFSDLFHVSDIVDADGDTVPLTGAEVQALLVGPLSSGVFGAGLRMEILNGDLFINGEELVNPKPQIAGLAQAFGWEYSEGDAESYASAHAQLTLGGYAWGYSGNGFQCGCVRCTREQLGEAIDWLAERWGWL